MNRCRPIDFFMKFILLSVALEKDAEKAYEPTRGPTRLCNLRISFQGCVKTLECINVRNPEEQHVNQ